MSQGKRLRSFLTRTISTVVLITFFVVFVYGGHVPLMFMVLGIQVCVATSFVHSVPAIIHHHQFTMVRELFNLALVIRPPDRGFSASKKKHRALPSFAALQWYWFSVAAIFLYFRCA